MLLHEGSDSGSRLVFVKDGFVFLAYNHRDLRQDLGFQRPDRIHDGVQDVLKSVELRTEGGQSWGHY